MTEKIPPPFELRSRWSGCWQIGTGRDKNKRKKIDHPGSAWRDLIWPPTFSGPLHPSPPPIHSRTRAAICWLPVPVPALNPDRSCPPRRPPSSCVAHHPPSFRKTLMSVARAGLWGLTSITCAAFNSQHQTRAFQGPEQAGCIPIHGAARPHPPPPSARPP